MLQRQTIKNIFFKPSEKEVEGAEGTCGSLNRSKSREYP